MSLQSGTAGGLTTLATATKGIRVRVDSLEAAGSSPADLPTWAGTARQHKYDPTNNVYNAKANNLRKVRNALARARAGTGKCRILVLGDSMALTYGTTSIKDKAAFPRAMAANLADMTGVEQAGSGLTPPVAANGLLNDTWTTTGTVTIGFNGLTGTAGLLTMAAGSTTTFFPEQLGDGVEFYYSNLSNNFTYQINGGTAVAVTPNGTSTQAKITVSGLGIGRQTLKINSTGTTYITSAQVTSTLSGIVVDNIAYGGTNAFGTGTGDSWTAADAATSMWRIREDPITLAGITHDLVLISLQGNDAFVGTSAANSMTAMQAIRTRRSAGDLVLMQAWEVTGTNAALWDQYYAAKYGLADTLNCAFFDWRDRHGNQAAAQAAGILAADNIHPSTGTTQEWGRNIAGVLAGVGRATPSGTSPTDNTVSATSYTFAEADAKRWTVFTAATAVTANIPLDTVDEMPIGTELNYRQSGAGAVEITVTGGTRTSRGNRFKTNGVGSVATAKKIAVNSWLIFGDLVT